MKLGKSLSELALEIERQAINKRDYIADTRSLTVRPTQESVELAMDNGTSLAIGAHAHTQIRERLQIPAKYYDRLLSKHPDLLAFNVNELFKREPEVRMIRTLDGTARAFLSDRYQRIDNNHVAETVLPMLARTPGIEIVSAEITERKLYIKAVTHAVRAEVKSRRVGDFVEAGVMISNSEVGMGALAVTPFMYFLACANGMVRNKSGMRATHVGTRIENEDDLAKLLADDTRKVLDQGILLKVRDVVTAAMDEVAFTEAVQRLQDTTEHVVRGDPVKVVEALANDVGFAESERSSVLRHLIEGGDLTRYGFINAVTRTAEDAVDYDRATEIETIGGRLLDLPNDQWLRLAA